MIKKYILFVTLIASSSCYLFFSVFDFTVFEYSIGPYDISETLDDFPGNIITQDILRKKADLEDLILLLSTWKNIEGASVSDKNRIHGDFKKNGIDSYWISEEKACYDEIFRFAKNLKKWEKALLDFWENECLLTNEDFFTLHKLQYERYKSSGFFSEILSDYKLVKFIKNDDDLKIHVSPLKWSSIYLLTSIIYLIFSIKWTYHMWVDKNWKNPIK